MGQTERAIKTRHQEHESDLWLSRIDLENDQEVSAERRMRSSRLVQHCIGECGLNPDWDEVKVIAKDSGRTTCRLRETFLTRKREIEGKRVINDTDLILHESWNQTLQKFWTKDFGIRGIAN